MISHENAKKSNSHTLQPSAAFESTPLRVIHDHEEKNISDEEFETFRAFKTAYIAKM